MGQQQRKLERRIVKWLACALNIHTRHIELVPATNEREDERVSRFCDVTAPRNITVAEMGERIQALGLHPDLDRGIFHLHTHDVARVAKINLYE